MMWDFSGGRQSYANPAPQVTMPSPGLYPANLPRGRSHSFSGAQPFVPAAAPVTSSNFLTVPQANVPVIHAHSDGDHYHRHSHHSHKHHHRSHSNPPPPDRGLVFADQHHYVSHSRHSSHSRYHSHGASTPQLHIHQTTPMPAPPLHHHVVSAPAVQTSHHHPHLQTMPLHPAFQYSKCTGRKKALCIGINYLGQPHELRGCINDARHMRDFLIRHWGYKSNDIVLLTDDSPNPRQQPTRRNIIDAMRWLVTGAHTHDALFFHYSGHGGQTRDLDGDEVDGYDEVIFPVDFKKRGHIIDDEMHDIMVKPLPAGCRLTGVFDSCHSGTVLDLPYIYSSHGRLKGSHVSKRARARKATPADVISWSGCKDGQTSADTFHGGVAVGAMSYAFITSLNQNPNQSYQQLLHSVRTILYPKYQQKPQLGSSHPIDTSLRFII